MHKITAVLLKGSRWLWMFFLISVAIFGLALTLATLNRWPQALIGLVIAGIPFVIWNIEKILSLACQMLCHTLRFTFRVIHRTFILVHKRKWTALLFWITLFLWNRAWALRVAILFLFLKLINGREPLSDDEWERKKSCMDMGDEIQRTWDEQAADRRRREDLDDEF